MNTQAQCIRLKAVKYDPISQSVMSSNLQYKSFDGFPVFSDASRSEGESKLSRGGGHSSSAAAAAAAFLSPLLASQTANGEESPSLSPSEAHSPPAEID